MSSFCTAKATHIFFSKKFQHICVSLDVNVNKSLTNNVLSFEQLGPGWAMVFFLGLYTVLSTHNIVQHCSMYRQTLKVLISVQFGLGIYPFVL